MVKVPLILAMVAIVGVFAEPPSPRQYLPPGQGQNGYSSRALQPSSQYGAPFSGRSRFGGQPSTPSSRYGAPFASSRNNGGNRQFGAPSNQFGAPSNQYGAPSNQFGAPSNQYGAPSAFNRYSNDGYEQFAAPSSQYGVPSSRTGNGGSFGGYATGRGGQEDPLAEPANYEFAYDVQDNQYGTAFGHQESRQGEEARGSYHVLLPDGRTQIVDYVANEEGFMPRISYEEGQGGYSGAGGRGGQGPY